MIDRNRVKKQFADYTSDYDATDEKIKLKIDHTYRVAALCEQIAQTEKLSKEETDLAWLLGMLHDVGRFEQLRRFGTFSDAESIDHAQFGANILFLPQEQGQKDTLHNRIRDYLDDSAEDQLLETAIRAHSAYRLPEGLDVRTVRFCNILRDADKIDILKVNAEIPLEAIYNVTTEELYSCMASASVMQGFFEEHAILRSNKKTPVDHVVGHMALVYELVYPVSIAIVRKQGYLNKLLHFRSENPQTREQFASLRKHMEDYLKRLPIPVF